MKVLYGEEKEFFLKRVAVLMLASLVILLMAYLISNTRNYDIPELYVKQSNFSESAKCIKEDFIDVEKNKQFVPQNIGEVWKYDDSNTLVLEPGSNVRLTFYSNPIGKVKENPKIILEKLYLIETSTNFTSNSNKLGDEFLWFGVQESRLRSKNCSISVSLTNNVVYIALVKVNYEHVGDVYYTFKLVNPKNSDIDDDKLLENYIGTYISETDRIENILNLLPYASNMVEYDIDNGNGKLVVDYNRIANNKYVDYNAVTLFSLIPLLDDITFNMSDKSISKSRTDYSSYDLKYNNIKNIMIELYGKIEGSNYQD